MKKFFLTGLVISFLGVIVAEEPNFYVGVCTHFAQNKGVISQNLDLVEQAGIVSIRDEVSWASVEKEKGILKIPNFFGSYLDEAKKRNISPLVLLNYSNKFYDQGNYPTSAEAIEGYARYCEEIVRFAGDRVKLYQLWNEWDGGCGMSYLGFGRGTAAGYTKVIKEVYPRLKKLAPHATFISNSVCTGETFLEDTFKLGLLDYCDAISFHPYNYNSGANTAEAWLERMKKLQLLIHKYNEGKDKDVYITEIGWPNHVTETGSTEQETAVKLARLYLYAQMLPFIKGIWWYDFQDDGWDFKYHENNFGLVRPDLTPKTPFFAIESLANKLSYCKVEEVKDLKGGYLIRFKNSDGPFWAIINNSYDYDLQLILETKNSDTPLNIETVGSKSLTRPWGYRDWTTRQPSIIPNQISIIAGEMPIILSGNLEMVNIIKTTNRPFSRADRPKQTRLQLPRYHAPVVKKGDKGQIMKLHTYQNLMKDEPYGGEKDLAANFECHYDRDNLYFTIEVMDNVFHQIEKNIAYAWRGDSIQLAFQTADAEGVLARTEIDIALCEDKAQYFIREAQGDHTKNPECSIERKTGKVLYKLKLPAQLLGTKAFESGGMLTCSFLINDNDGSGRKGFLYWGEGIGINKNPNLYNLLTFQ